MSDTNKKNHAKHKPKGGMIDGVGGAGGASGTGGERVKPDYVGDVSGIDADVDTDEIPMPGSTGKAGPDNARSGHSDGGMSGKNRGNSTETEPSRSDGNG